MRMPGKIAVYTAALMMTGLGVMSACGSDSSTGPATIHYAATLNAAAEKQANPVNSTATGSASFTLRGNDSLDFAITVAGLTAPATASHIHVGATTVSGPVVNGFTIVSGVTTGTVASGTIVLSKLVAGAGQVSGDSLHVLLENGNAYVNVHTSTYPAGEVRGQIARQ